LEILIYEKYRTIMESGRQLLSFGRYLQSKRLEKKMSLEQIARQTRIGVDTLLLIEQEDHSRLPAPVFVKGFLRAYAKAVGADGDEAVRHYESRLDVVKKIAEAEDRTKRQTGRRRLSLFSAVVIYFCLIILSIYGMKLWGPQTSEEPAAVYGHPAAGSGTPGVLESSSGPENRSSSAPASPAKLTLKIVVDEVVWMKVIIDGREPTEYSLVPGDRLELKADGGYNLLIGNAGGVKITLNGKPVPVPGKSGQVVSLRLP